MKNEVAPMTRMQVELKAVARIKRYVKGEISKVAIDFTRGRFNDQMEDLGMDDDAILEAWMDCYDMAKLEIAAEWSAQEGVA